MRATRSTPTFLVYLATLALGAATLADVEAAPETLLRQGRIDEAVAKLKNQLAKSPDDAEANHLLCRAYFAVEAYEESIRSCERAVSLFPKRSDYHLWLGRAYGRRAEEVSFIRAASLARKMRSELEQAVALDGKNVSARTDLAEFYMEAPAIVGGGKDKARKEADALAGIDTATAHWVKARLSEKDNDLRAAEFQYKAAIEDSSGRADNWLSLASFYRRQGRFDEMQQAIDKALAAPKKQNNILYDAASLLWRAGRNFPAAIEQLNKYLAALEQSEEAPAFQARFLLGQIYEKQGNKAVAREQYQEALKLARDYSKARDALNRLR